MIKNNSHGKKSLSATTTDNSNINSNNYNYNNNEQQRSQIFKDLLAQNCNQL